MTQFCQLISDYHQQLNDGRMQKAYHGLQIYLGSLKAWFNKNLPQDYSVGNLSPGYMDYSYFPFFNRFLRSRKLRFGIVLNHEDMRFELWLMGQNSSVQDKYWQHLKGTKWNRHLSDMPRYSVLEAILVEEPDFSDLESLNREIYQRASLVTDEVVSYIRATPWTD
ncbi:DUF7000 family protein [Vibrio sonorensis]|uniref:DUF7000 family protein n=1 Tax=Vibrio sonorensis TaxID=1004316 RepID=UPI0008D92946|nr:hypothetical protein [Vibrio sonorensis]